MNNKTIFLLVLNGVFAFLALAIGKSNSNDSISLILIFVGFLAGGGIYLLPSYISALRNSGNFAAIFVLNLIGTLVIGLGWLGALIWALADQRNKSENISR